MSALERYAKALEFKSFGKIVLSFVETSVSVCC